jgi:hypothetical protein
VTTTARDIVSRSVDFLEDAEAREVLLRLEELGEREGRAFLVREAVLHDEGLRAPVATQNRLAEGHARALGHGVRHLHALSLRRHRIQKSSGRLHLRVHVAPIHVEGLQESPVVADRGFGEREAGLNGESRKEQVLRHRLDARHGPRRDDRAKPFLDLERHVEGVPRDALRHGRRGDPRVPEPVGAIERLEGVTVFRRVSIHVSSGLEEAARAHLERAEDGLRGQTDGAGHLHGGDRPSLPFLDRERHELLVRRRFERDVHLRARVTLFLIRAAEPVLQELKRVFVRRLAPRPG